MSENFEHTYDGFWSNPPPVPYHFSLSNSCPLFYLLSPLSAACMCVGVGPSAGGKHFAPDH